MNDEMLNLEEKLAFQQGKIDVINQLLVSARRYGIIHLRRSELEESLTEQQNIFDELFIKLGQRGGL